MSVRKHSRDRRSSKRSILSSAETSVESGSKIDFTTIFFEKKLQTILEQEEQDLIIYSVREDLMRRVMEECEKVYVERQTVHFVVHCAYRALVQLVDLGLFNHDPGRPFYLNHPVWQCDQAPKPSPTDTWAAHKVPVKQRSIPEPISAESTEVESQLSQAIVVGNIFGSELEELPPSEEEVHVLYTAASSLGRGSTEEKESEIGLIAPTATEISVTGEEEQLPNMPAKTTSIFTHTTLMSPEQLPHSMKSGRSKLKAFLGHLTTQPPFPTDEQSIGSKISTSVLPPLRKEAKFTKVPPPPKSPTEEGGDTSPESK